MTMVKATAIQTSSMGMVVNIGSHADGDHRGVIAPCKH
jgi:hypothetical protein